jgi:two-component system response regulator PilR (NtrC family)
MIERAIALSSTDMITASDLPDVKPQVATPAAPPTELPAEGVDLDRLLSDYERGWVLRALEQTAGIRKRAAALLGISFRSFRYRLEKLGIDIDRSGNPVDDEE